ncbi:MAG: glycosyltransferase, partial [Burkholderiales bacterium]
MSTVVHAITGLGTGGAEMMLYKLVRSIDQEQFRTVVVSLIDKGKIGNRIEALGVSVHALGLSRGTSPIRALWVFARLISELRPALVQGWMYHANLASSMATAISRTRPPVVWNVRASLDGLDREKRSTA